MHTPSPPAPPALPPRAFNGVNTIIHQFGWPVGENMGCSAMETPKASLWTEQAPTNRPGSELKFILQQFSLHHTTFTLYLPTVPHPLSNLPPPSSLHPPSTLRQHPCSFIFQLNATLGLGTHLNDSNTSLASLAMYSGTPDARRLFSKWPMNTSKWLSFRPWWEGGGKRKLAFKHLVGFNPWLVGGGEGGREP